MVRRFRQLLVLPGVLLIASAGCGGSSDAPAVFPVAGVVSWEDGKPVAGATVTFGGIGSKAQLGGTGKTNDKGEFTLMTSTGQSGVPKGKYKVLVAMAKTAVNAPTTEAYKKEMMDRYAAPKGADNAAPTDVADTTIPADYGDPAKTPLEYEVTGESSDKSVKLAVKK